MPKRLGLLTVTASHKYAQVCDFFAQSYTRPNTVEPSTRSLLLSAYADLACAFVYDLENPSDG